ncbi:uncharacterized protein HaLaN_06190, partial [Haematococcus lacustris]
MEQMRSLDVSRNHLSALPISIGGMHRCLSSLRLEHNQLSVLPRELALLTTLSHLTLHGNPLVHPPRQVAAGELLLRVQLEREAFEQRCAHLAAELDKVTKQAHGLDQESKALAQELKGVADPPCLPDGTACSSADALLLARE